MKDNKYREYAKYYDLIMQSGYYDHEEYARGAVELIKEESRVLEIGVGSGLFVEKVAELGHFNLTGIDFSPAMLELAESRLKNIPSLELIEGDILSYTFEKPFDVIISTGGPISMSYRGEEQTHRLFAYSSSFEQYKHMLSKLYSLLKKDSLVLISIQEAHKDYSIHLTEDIEHIQEVVFLEKHLQKTYLFNKGGIEVGRQTIQTMFFDEKDFLIHFEEAGFKSIGLNKRKNYYIFKKA